jgi:hypothetical protein
VTTPGCPVVLAVVDLDGLYRGQILAVHPDQSDLPVHERRAYQHAAAVDGVIVALPVIADLRKDTR